MFFRRAGAWLFASLILATVSIGLRNSDFRPDFGMIDPAYRNAHSDTAWFIRQNQDGDDDDSSIDAATTIDDE